MLRNPEYNSEDSRFMSTFVKTVKPHNDSFVSDYSDRIGKDNNLADSMYLAWEPLPPLHRAYRNHHRPEDVEGRLKLHLCSVTSTKALKTKDIRRVMTYANELRVVHLM